MELPRHLKTMVVVVIMVAVLVLDGIVHHVITIHQVVEELHMLQLRQGYYQHYQIIVIRL